MSWFHPLPRPKPRKSEFKFYEKDALKLAIKLHHFIYKEIVFLGIGIYTPIVL